MSCNKPSRRASTDASGLRTFASQCSLQESPLGALADVARLLQVHALHGLRLDWQRRPGAHDRIQQCHAVAPSLGVIAQPAQREQQAWLNLGEIAAQRK